MRFQYAAIGLIGISAPAFGATYIDFSGISPTSLPKTINYGGGSVTVSATSSVFAGSPLLAQYTPGAGTNGYESPVGGIKMGIGNTSAGFNSWQIRLAFSRNQFVTVHNTETYTNFEETIVQSDGVWSQVDSSPNLHVGGLGLNTLALAGVYGAAGPFGYGHWSTTANNLYITYVFNGATGDSAGNGIEIAVPEPASATMLGMAAIGVLARRRTRTSHCRASTGPRRPEAQHV